MSAGAISAVRLTSFENHDGAAQNPLQALQWELAQGNIPNAQQALAQYSKRLSESPDNPVSNAMPANVEGLRSALATGDLAAAQTLALSIRQAGRKNPAEGSPVSSDVQEIEESTSNGGLLDLYA